MTAITPTPAATLVDVRSDRWPAAGEVQLGATKEAGFGVRVLDVLRLQWRAAVHDGTAGSAGVAQLYARFLAACRDGLERTLAWPE